MKNWTHERAYAGGYLTSLTSPAFVTVENLEANKAYRRDRKNCFSKAISNFFCTKFDKNSFLISFGSIDLYEYCAANTCDTSHYDIKLGNNTNVPFIRRGTEGLKIPTVSGKVSKNLSHIHTQLLI